MVKAQKNAHYRVAAAIHRGDLVVQPCELCGDRATVAHHDDYSEPLDVRWLCGPCHFGQPHKHYGEANYRAVKIADDVAVALTRLKVEYRVASHNKVLRRLLGLTKNGRDAKP